MLQRPCQYIAQTLPAPENCNIYCNTYLGQYAQTLGERLLIEDIVKYIEKRDGGIPANPDEIFVTNGAGEALKVCNIIYKLLSNMERGGCRKMYIFYICNHMSLIDVKPLGDFRRLLYNKRNLH